MRRLALIVALLTLPVMAADVETTIRTTFVQPWVQALLANDPARLVAFLHPKVRACITPETRDLFEIGAVDPKSVRAKYLVTKLGPLKPPAPLFGLPEDGFAYPVEPTYELQLEFEETNTLAVRFLALSAGYWRIVMPCPNEKGLAYYRETVARGQEQQQRVAELVAGLKDPLLGELK